MHHFQKLSPSLKPTSADTARQLRLFFWALSVVLGGVCAWLSRFQMSPDGVSYLDIGDAFWHGHWGSLANAYWSPLYPLILGCFMNAFRPSVLWEYPLVRLVNFVIFLGAAACFEFLLTAALEELPPKGALLSKLWHELLGYSIFLSTTLVLITVTAPTPDMLVAAFVFVIAGIGFRLYRNPDNQKLAYSFGIALGLGYYAKTILLPVGIAFFLTLLAAQRVHRKNLLTAGIMFFLMTLFLVSAISRQKHRVTIGESGRWNYLVLFNHVNPFFPVGGIHQAKKIPDVLPIYDFRGTIPGTYPVWYDPSYWEDGIRPHWNAPELLNRFKHALIACIPIFILPNLELSLVLGFIAFAALGLSIPIRMPLLLMLIPSAAALCAYTVLVVEFRYLAPFLCLIWIGLFFGFDIDDRRITKVVIAFMVAANIGSVIWLLPNLAKTNNRFYREIPAAIELHQHGLRSGDKIALISREAGVVAGQGMYIPRLAKLQIICELIDPDKFLATSHIKQAEVLSKLESTGAKAALLLPDRTMPDSSWLPLDKSGYFFKPLVVNGKDQERTKQ